MHIVLCGSMSAAASMIRLSHDLETLGHSITMPENIQEHANDVFIENAAEKKELDVFKKYFMEIQNADAILVCNEPKGDQQNYIGPNSLIEMAFAHVFDKTIYILHDVPPGNFRDEIDAMHPIALHNSLNNISS
jgi:hypothetical protein